MIIILMPNINATFLITVSFLCYFEENWRINLNDELFESACHIGMDEIETIVQCV